MLEKINISILGNNNKIDLINQVIAKGYTKIHYDVMDGKFTNSIAMEMPELKEIFSKTKKHIKDIHLMVNNPIPYLDTFVSSVDYITFHFEVMNNKELKEVIKNYKDKTKLGLAANPQTPIESIKPFVKDLSQVLIMGVVPGASGQSFIENTIEKIKELKSFINQNNLKTKIFIDGGINEETGIRCLEAGADKLVSSSFILNKILD